MGKGNVENLKSLKDRTTEEQREIARKGGIASGKVRKEQSLFKKAFLAALNTKIEVEENGEKKKKTVLVAGSFAIAKKVADGDIEAARFVRDTIGEKPTDKLVASTVNLNELPNEKFERITSLLEGLQ